MKITTSVALLLTPIAICILLILAPIPTIKSFEYLRNITLIAIACIGGLVGIGIWNTYKL